MKELWICSLTMKRTNMPHKFLGMNKIVNDSSNIETNQKSNKNTIIHLYQHHCERQQLSRI